MASNGQSDGPSPQQWKYVRDLYRQGAQQAAQLGRLLDGETESQMVDRLMARLCHANMADVSKAIDAALAGLRMQRAELDVRPAVEAQRLSSVVEDGVYVVGDQYVKVIVAVHGSGRQYAKLWDVDSESWTFLPGGVKKVAARGTKIDSAAARRFGELYGRCVICSRTLTDEESIKNGIGPVCASRIG